jgi:ribosomal protein S15P/S13E
MYMPLARADVTLEDSSWIGFPKDCRLVRTTANQQNFFFWLGLGPEIPEDLYHLIKKAVAVRKHLERNRKDKDSKFRLILIESRVHRLARYYKRTKKLPPTWK